MGQVVRGLTKEWNILPCVAFASQVGLRARVSLESQNRIGTLADLCSFVFWEDLIEILEEDEQLLGGLF